MGFRIAVLLSLCFAFSTPAGADAAAWLRAALLGDRGQSESSAVTRLSRYVRSAASAAAGVSLLGATVSPEGHWTFVNASGEAMTAATPEEMRRVLPMLTGPAAAQVDLVLADEALLDRPEHLKALPRTLSLSVLLGTSAFPLVEKDGRRLIAIRPAVWLDAGTRPEVYEALSQLSRRLAGPDLRLLSLVVDGPQTLTPRPVIDGGRTVTDAIDPMKLPAALSALSGQTAVVIGRADGPRLAFRTPSGGERSVLLDDLVASAARFDVDLVVLQATAARQPGTRNWLWQRIEVAGFDAARERPSVADFLDAYAGGDPRQPVIVRLAESDGLRTRLVLTRPAGGALGDFLAGLSAEVTGRVTTTGADAYLVGSARRQELQRRIVPGVPSPVQAVYLAGLVAGLAGIVPARRWWSRLWRREEPGEYGHRVGYLAARGVETVAFVLLFLPLAGLPAAAVQIGRAAVDMALWPVRAAGRLRSASKSERTTV